MLNMPYEQFTVIIYLCKNKYCCSIGTYFSFKKKKKCWAKHVNVGSTTLLFQNLFDSSNFEFKYGLIGVLLGQQHTFLNYNLPKVLKHCRKTVEY